MDLFPPAGGRPPSPTAAAEAMAVKRLRRTSKALPYVSEPVYKPAPHGEAVLSGWFHKSNRGLVSRKDAVIRGHQILMSCHTNAQSDRIAWRDALCRVRLFLPRQSVALHFPLKRGRTNLPWPEPLDICSQKDYKRSYRSPERGIIQNLPCQISLECSQRPAGGGSRNAAYNSNAGRIP